MMGAMKKIILTAAILASLPAMAEDRARSLGEMSASIREKAAKIDVNGDGILSDEETSKGKEKLGFLSSAISRRVDANSDGVITVDEYVRVQVEQIEQADTNGDGMLTVDEQKAQKRRLIGELLSGR